MDHSRFPIIVIGAGPIGLAAAAHLVAAGEQPLVVEAGTAIGTAIRAWGHVRLFSPWQFNIDKVAASLLERGGWQAPNGDTFPTGAELVEQYLEPLAALPQVAPHIRLNTRVSAITRQGFDKMKTIGRAAAPLLVAVQTATGEDVVVAKAVIDASGTYSTPNPLGASGVPAPGERAAASHIFYGIPDVLNRDRNRYAHRSVLVVGSGHSAFNTLLDLAELAAQVSATQITWAVRRADMRQAYGGGASDLLAARGALGMRVRALVESGVVGLVTSFRVQRLVPAGTQVLVVGEHSTLGPFDEIIATTGFRPDLSPLAELRLNLDPAVECPAALAPLIDPNVHSCGTVRPHGAEELKHPDPDFYVVGMKSYGRAPTFLMLTGYEQVRSVVAAITGNWEAARQVQLELPETGVCFTDFNPGATTCCSGSETATQGATACCGAAAACCAEAPALVVERQGLDLPVVQAHGAKSCCSS